MNEENVTVKYPKSFPFFDDELEVAYSPEDDNGQVVASCEYVLFGENIFVQSEPAWPPSQAVELLDRELVSAIQHKPFYETQGFEISHDTSFDSRNSILGKLPVVDSKITIGIELDGLATWHTWVESINGETSLVPESFRRGGIDAKTFTDVSPQTARLGMYDAYWQHLIQQEN